MQTSTGQSYRLFQQGRTVPIAPERHELAAKMDTDGDGFVSSDEIATFYGMKPEGAPDQNRARRIEENKWHLRGKPNPDAAFYKDYAQVTAELESLQEQFLDQCKLVSLGRTHEGREIWALKVSSNSHEDTSHKPGTVITGCHHAREWTTVEVPLHSARKLLESAQEGDPQAVQLLEKGEFWFVPLVNPDGYEHSLTEDNMWRKNRRPISKVVDGVMVEDYGVDPSRNYGDGSPLGEQIYRPSGDTPAVTKDDFEYHIDHPSSFIHRGPHAASEAEVEANQQLKLGRANIRGALDYHSFGEAIIHPFGYTKTAVPELELYQRLGEELNQASGGTMEVKSSADLYPVTGNSVDIQHINGIISYTMEINRCFQVPPEEIRPTCERFHQVNLLFMESIVNLAQAGQLPDRIVPERYRSQASIEF